VSIMPCRYDELVKTVAGYAKTGLQLIGFDGTQIFPSGISDDVGLYYFIPKLVRLFGISLDYAIEIFFYGMVVASCVFGIAGFFLLNRSWLFRTVAVAGLVAFSFVSCRGMTDVYLVASSLAVALVPWALYFMRGRKKNTTCGIFLFLSGVAIGYAHYIRAFSGGAVFIFLFLSLVLNTMRPCKNRLLLCGVLLCGLIVPIVHFKLLLADRKNYFGDQFNTFEARHVFWHSVCGGFGFLNNDLGIAWDDKAIIEKIKKNNPRVEYPTREYEVAARKEVFNLARNRLHFFMTTIFAKLGIIFYYFLLFANIGLFVAFFFRKSWRIELLFLSALVFSSLFGIIALPGRYYLSGFIAFAVLYGLVSIEYAIGVHDEYHELSL